MVQGSSIDERARGSSGLRVGLRGGVAVARHILSTESSSSSGLILLALNPHGQGARLSGDIFDTSDSRTVRCQTVCRPLAEAPAETKKQLWSMPVLLEGRLVPKVGTRSVPSASALANSQEGVNVKVPGTPYGLLHTGTSICGVQYRRCQLVWMAGFRSIFE